MGPCAGMGAPGRQSVVVNVSVLRPATLFWRLGGATIGTILYGPSEVDAVENYEEATHSPRLKT